MVGTKSGAIGAENQENIESDPTGDAAVNAALDRYHGSPITYVGGNLDPEAFDKRMSARGDLIAAKPSTIGGLIAKHEVFLGDERGPDDGVYYEMMMAEAKGIDEQEK